MIPLSSKRVVEYKDEDGVVWLFKPRCGQVVEDFLCLINRAGDDSISPVERLRESNEFVNRILVGWRDAQNRMPEWPSDNRPSELLTQEEIAQVFTMWQKSGSLTAEEKKS